MEQRKKLISISSNPFYRTYTQQKCALMHSPYTHNNTTHRVERQYDRKRAKQRKEPMDAYNAFSHPPTRLKYIDSSDILQRNQLSRAKTTPQKALLTNVPSTDPKKKKLRLGASFLLISTVPGSDSSCSIRNPTIWP